MDEKYPGNELITDVAWLHRLWRSIFIIRFFCIMQIKKGISTISESLVKIKYLQFCTGLETLVINPKPEWLLQMDVSE